jgi:hypothetical protein
MFDVLHQNGNLSFERWGCTGQSGKLDQQVLHLAMLLDSLAYDLLQFLITFLQEVWVEDRLFDVRVHVELFFDLLKRCGIISILIRLYLRKERLDLSVVRFQQLYGVGR